MREELSKVNWEGGRGGRNETAFQWCGKYRKKALHENKRIKEYGEV